VGPALCSQPTLPDV
jgi:hypothetical protein